MTILTEVVRRNPYCVIVLDEVEEAYPDVFNVLLQVFDDGLVSGGQAHTEDFKNTVVAVTANVGCQVIQRWPATTTG